MTRHGQSTTYRSSHLPTNKQKLKTTLMQTKQKSRSSNPIDLKLTFFLYINVSNESI